MKPKLAGYTEDLYSLGGGLCHKAESTVRYRKHRVKDFKGVRTGAIEYWYLNEDNMNLIRYSELLIKTDNGK